MSRERKYLVKAKFMDKKEGKFAILSMNVFMNKDNLTKELIDQVATWAVDMQVSDDGRFDFYNIVSWEETK